MRYLIRRLVLFVAALFGLSLLVFVALRILPGDVASVMAGTNATPERVAALRSQMGLDRPYPRQYADWLSGLMRGDMGASAISGRSVASQIGSHASITMPLIVLSLIVALGVGIPLGCQAVLATHAWVRGLLHALAIIGGAVPALWGGLLLIMLFGRGVGLMGVLPSQGFPDAGWRDPAAAIAALILPAVATGLVAGAAIMRYTRACLMSMEDSDAVAMAMACGMTRRQAMLGVGLRLSAAQLVSVAGLTFAQMITGVMVVESLFNLPGLGAMLINDVGNRDLVAVQSELFLLAAFFLLLGVLVDMVHHALDPRLGEQSEEV
ncbi:ABC transporter permease [Bifidobacterium apri]|uniref:ABC transporter permease n=1 Tax=Bifidobacterium apri TaxID=1769423 RepID=UPI003995F45F